MLKEAGGSFRRVYCRNILYVESANRKVLLHLENGETIEEATRSLDELDTAASRQTIFPCADPSPHYEPLFCGENGYRQVHSPVC